MRHTEKRTAAEWFEAARGAYIESHQGCARCGRQHCVFRCDWGQRVEYHCTACDFSASYDEETKQAYSCDGEPAGAGEGSGVGLR
jgi:hypothetical protein